MMNKVQTRLYLFALIATVAIFILALVVSDYINKRKTSELQTTEDKIAVDILSLETQFDLITNTTCASFDDSTIQSQLDGLDSRLTFMEGQLGLDDPAVFRLKRYYSLLEIKHYLLTKKMVDQCKRTEIPILYFYAAKNCNECTRQEYMLRAIKQEYPQTRIYTFDYTLDLPAVQTLISLHNVPKNPPVIDINGKLYAAFDTLDDMRLIIQSLATSSTSSGQATTKNTSQ